MGYLKYVKQLWQRPKERMPERYRELLLELRRKPATERIERPTNIARARSIGYKPKQGVLVIRQRLIRGGRQRPDIKGGRRTAHSGQRKIVQKNYAQVAEERASRQYRNCEVIGSYLLMKDGRHAWYEVILADRMAPTVHADVRLSAMVQRQGRAHRGLTSAGRKARGLRSKGQGAEKVR